MKELLFEDPLWLYVALAAAEMIVLALFLRRRTRALAIALAVPAALAAAVFAADMLVVTDRERIEAALKDMAAKLEHRDLQGVSAYLADDFGGDYADKHVAVSAAEAALKTYRIDGIRTRNVRIEMLGEQAKVHLQTAIHFNSDAGPASYTLGWTLFWAKRNGEWRIFSVNVPEVAKGL